MACIDTAGKLKCKGEEMEIVSQEDTIMCFCSNMKHLKELDFCKEVERDVDECEVVKNEGACCETGGIQCTFIKDEVVARPFRFTTMAKGQYEFESANEDTTIQNLQDDKFMKKRENVVSMSDYSIHKSVRITISYYKFSVADGPFQGNPVVLNFTNSDYYLKCSADDGKVSLIVEYCERQKLQRFCHSDKDRLAFLFYMKAKQDRSHLFESAVYAGWFMRARSNRIVMQPLSPDNESCYFLIQKK